VDIPNDVTLKEVKSNFNKAIDFFPDDSEREILSEKFLTLSHLQEISFKHILTQTPSPISTPNSVDTVYKFYPNPFIHLLIVYYFLMLCPILFPFLLKSLTDL